MCSVSATAAVSPYYSMMSVGFLKKTGGGEVRVRVRVRLQDHFHSATNALPYACTLG